MTASLLVLIVPLTTANSIATEAPMGDSVCLVCSSNADCSSYADYSICLRGQCTSDRGLFGQGCKCQGNDECATARCDGVFQQTCRQRKDNGGICNQNSDCKSDRCNNLFLCAEPVANIGGSDTTDTVPEDSTETSSEEGRISNNTDSAVEEAPEFTLEDLISCKDCEDDAECGEGFCVDKMCTDPTGAHPPFCVQCISHDECTENYYCNADLLLGQTGRKCQAKKRNGEGCNRRDECRSNHCNILWKCESTVPDHKRNPVLDTDVFGDGPSLASIMIWFCVAFAVFLFGFGSFVFCRKDGFRKTFGRRKAEDKKAAATVANTDAVDGVLVDSTENSRSEVCQICEKDDCAGCSVALATTSSTFEGHL